MSYRIQVIDNFLSEEDFRNLKSVLTGSRFPWYFLDGTDYENDGTHQFVYSFYGPFSWIGDSSLVEPLVKKLDPLALIRIKANLQPPTHKIVVNKFHTDVGDEPVKTAIFYVNTNDGKTIFKTGEEINSVENRMVVFDQQLFHTGTTCTGTFPRIVINFNYVPKLKG